MDPQTIMANHGGVVHLVRRVYMGGVGLITVCGTYVRYYTPVTPETTISCKACAAGLNKRVYADLQRADGVVT